LFGLDEDDSSILVVRGLYDLKLNMIMFEIYQRDMNPNSTISPYGYLTSELDQSSLEHAEQDPLRLLTSNEGNPIMRHKESK
jgi:hypothetical protein